MKMAVIKYKHISSHFYHMKSFKNIHKYSSDEQKFI
jgi:hypothetical protein